VKQLFVTVGFVWELIMAILLALLIATFIDRDLFLRMSINMMIAMVSLTLISVIIIKLIDNTKSCPVSESNLGYVDKVK